MPPGMQHSDNPAMKSISPSISSSRNSHLPTAHSATLPGLPTELVIGIFKAVDSFATASTLSKTSHHLYSVWKINIDAILPSVVDCFPQAQELAHAQEENHPRRQLFSPPRSDIKTAQRISINASLVSSIFRSYELRVLYDCVRKGVTRDRLTPNERADFVRAAYRSMAVAVEANGRSIPHSLFESLDMQMREAMDFLNYWFNKEIKNPRNHNIHIETTDLAQAVSQASHHLRCFHLDLMRLPVNHGDFRYGDSAPSDYYFTVADGYQEKAVSGRGALLADLLPLLVKKYVFEGPSDLSGYGWDILCDS